MKIGKKRATPTSVKRFERGQILPLFALMLVVILGMAALAIDVGRKYADLRVDRRAADAASLAGGQDLQQDAGTRAVGQPERYRARLHALSTLVDELGATAAG